MGGESRPPPQSKEVLTIAQRKTTTSNAVKDRWKAANYTRVSLYLTKDQAAEYKAKCEAAGINMSDIPRAAIEKFLRDE